MTPAAADRAPRALLLWPALFLLAVVVVPVARLVWEGAAGVPNVSNTPDALDWLSVWRDDYLRHRLLWSLGQACLSTACTLVLGVPVGWVLARYGFVGRAWVLRLLMLPFVVPTLVAALGVLALWGPQGWASDWLGWAAEESPWLLVIGNLFFNLCLVVKAVVEALGQVSANRLAAARTLGATPWRAFWRVEWPAIRLAVASAACLVALYCFAGMGLALVLGGQRWATAEVEIYTLVAHELRLADASALALWTMGAGGLLAWLHAWLAARLAVPRTGQTVPLRPATTVHQRLGVGAALAVLAVCCLAPLAASVGWALRDVAAVWAVWTEPDTLDALWNTVRFSAMALGLALSLGLCQGLAVHHWRRWRPRWATWVQGSTFVPFVASPVTVAFGLLLLYPEQSGSLLLLVAAYALLAYPFVAQHLTEALAVLPPHWQQAARTLGARPWRVFLRVTLPLVWPAVRRGLAFAAATALGEFAVSLFLSRPEWTTLTTLIYQHLGRPGADNLFAAHALALLLMLLALGVFLLLEPRSPSAPARPSSAD